ncbi:MAG TPA: hypothetical protein VE974_09025 [Thermoanaerobaculia bacterium]|nr:hypothetical protein [Thermoanaerobaculia bacterium]
MSIQRSLLFVAVLLLTAFPAFASCTQGDCLVGPCICLRWTGDVSFSDTSCGLWDFTGTGTRASSGSQYYGEIASGIGTVEQELWGGGTGTEVEVQVDVTIVPGNPVGNERLIVEVRSLSGTLLETLDIIDADEGSGYREYHTSGYNQDVILRFRRGTGLNDSDSVFRVDNVAFWVCGV